MLALWPRARSDEMVPQSSILRVITGRSLPCAMDKTFAARRLLINIEVVSGYCWRWVITAASASPSSLPGDVGRRRLFARKEMQRGFFVCIVVGIRVFSWAGQMDNGE